MYSLSQNWAFAVVGPALWNDTPPALQSVMLEGISPVSLHSLKNLGPRIVRFQDTGLGSAPFTQTKRYLIQID